MEEQKNYNPENYAGDYNESDFWAKIKNTANKVGRELVDNALRLYYAMSLKKISAGQIAIVVAALGYFICPIDLIPDVLPVVGYTDDAGVLIGAVKAISACSDKEVIAAATAKLKEWFG